jgi:hypothetical protein
VEEGSAKSLENSGQHRFLTEALVTVAVEMLHDDFKKFNSTCKLIDQTLTSKKNGLCILGLIFVKFPSHVGDARN